MTLSLSAFFEKHIISIISDHKSAIQNERRARQRLSYRDRLHNGGSSPPVSPSPRYWASFTNLSLDTLRYYLFHSGVCRVSAAPGNVSNVAALDACFTLLFFLHSFRSTENMFSCFQFSVISAGLNRCLKALNRSWWKLQAPCCYVMWLIILKCLCLFCFHMSSPKGKHKSGKVSKPKKSQTSTKNRSQRSYQGTTTLLWLHVLCRILWKLLLVSILGSKKILLFQICNGINLVINDKNILVTFSFVLLSKSLTSSTSWPWFNLFTGQPCVLVFLPELQVSRKHAHFICSVCCCEQWVSPL